MRVSVLVGWTAEKDAPRAERPLMSPISETEPAVLDDVDAKLLGRFVRRKSGRQLRTRRMIKLRD